MSIKKKAKHCQPGDVIKVDEHKLVRYPGSENKGVCRYLVVEKVKGRGIMVYRITTKAKPIKLWNPSIHTKFAYLNNMNPILVPLNALLNVQNHRLENTHFLNIKLKLRTNRHSKYKYHRKMQELKAKIPKLP